jgi:hypothetical protein
MTYIPSKTTKVLLVFFIAIITFHVCFLSSSKIAVNRSILFGSNISKMEYQIYLSSYERPFDIAQCINETETNYFFNLPYETIYVIYCLYFVIASLIVMTIKVKSKLSGN